MAMNQASSVFATRLLRAVVLACIWIAGLPGFANAERPVRFAWFIDFSPDGASLVTSYGGWDADEGGEIRIWDVTTGDMKWVASQPRGLRASAWSPGGTLVACGSYGGSVGLFDTKSGEQKLEVTTGGDSVELVQITPDEQFVIAGTTDGVVWIWEIATGKEFNVIPTHNKNIWGMRLSSDGKTLATAGPDRTARVTDLETGKQLYRFEHPAVAMGVAFTPDGRHLVSGCHDSEIRVWELDAGQLARTISGHRGSVNDFDFSPDGKLLASSSSDRTVRVWEFETGQLLASLRGHRQAIYDVRFSPDGTLIASSGWDAAIKIWDVKTQKEIRTLVRQEK